MNITEYAIYKKLFGGGGKPVPTIIFYWNATPLQCEEGMTWREFIDSKYNLDGYFYTDIGAQVWVGPYKYHVYGQTNSGGYNMVYDHDYIVAGCDYTV